MSYSRAKTLVGAAWEVDSWQYSSKPLVTPQQPHGFTLRDCLSRAGNIASSFFYFTLLALTTLRIHIFRSLCFYLCSAKLPCQWTPVVFFILTLAIGFLLELSSPSLQAAANLIHSRFCLLKVFHLAIPFSSHSFTFDRDHMASVSIIWPQTILNKYRQSFPTRRKETFVDCVFFYICESQTLWLYMFILKLLICMRYSFRFRWISLERMSRLLPAAV